MSVTVNKIKELYGISEDELKPLPEIRILKEGEVVIGRVAGVRMINTVFGERLVIDLKLDGGKQVAVLVVHKSLAREIVKLMKKHEKIEGMRIKIMNEGKKGRAYRYYVGVEPEQVKLGGKAK